MAALLPGYSRTVVATNIHELKERGYGPEVARQIAYEEARRWFARAIEDERADVVMPAWLRQMPQKRVRR